jgi:ClpP class serine protease
VIVASGGIVPGSSPPNRSVGHACETLRDAKFDDDVKAVVLHRQPGGSVFATKSSPQIDK